MPYLRREVSPQRGLWPMGRPRVPPLPAMVVMEDRASGVAYMLSQTGEPGNLVVSILPNTYKFPDVSYFGPYDGPYLPRYGNETIRLYLENGSLKGEHYSPPYHQSPRVLTRRGWQRRLIEITIGPTWEPGDDFTLTEVQL